MSSSQITTIDDKMDVIHDIETTKLTARIELLYYIVYAIQELINPYLEITGLKPLSISIDKIPTADHLDELYEEEKNKIIELEKAKAGLETEANRGWLSAQFNKKEYSQAKVKFDKASDERQLAFLNASAETKKLNKSIKDFALLISNQLKDITIQDDSVSQLKDKLLLYVNLINSSIDTKKVFAEPLFIALNKSKQYLVNINSIKTEAQPYVSKLDEMNITFAKLYLELDKIYQEYSANYKASNFQFNETYNDQLGAIFKNIETTVSIIEIRKKFATKGGDEDEVTVNKKVKDSEKIIKEAESFKQEIITLYNSSYDLLQKSVSNIEASIRQVGKGLGTKKNFYKYVPGAIETIYTTVQTLETKFKINYTTALNTQKKIEEKISSVEVLTKELQDSINTMLNLSKEEIANIRKDLEDTIKKEKLTAELIAIKNNIDKYKNSIETTQLVIDNSLKPIDDYLENCKKYLETNIKEFKKQNEDAVVFTNVTNILNDKNIGEFIPLLQKFSTNFSAKKVEIKQFNESINSFLKEAIYDTFTLLEKIQEDANKINENDINYKNENTKLDNYNSILEKTQKTETEINNKLKISDELLSKLTKENINIETITKEITANRDNLINQITRLKLDDIESLSKILEDLEIKFTNIITNIEKPYEHVAAEKDIYTFLEDIYKQFNEKLGTLIKEYEETITTAYKTKKTELTGNITTYYSNIETKLNKKPAAEEEDEEEPAKNNMSDASASFEVSEDELTDFKTELIVGQSSVEQAVGTAGLSNTYDQQKNKEILENLQNLIKSKLTKVEDLNKAIQEFIKELDNNFNHAYSITDLFNKKEVLLTNFSKINLDKINTKTQEGGAILKPLVDIVTNPELEKLNKDIFTIPSNTPEQDKYKKDFEINYNKLLALQKQVKTITDKIKTTEQNFTDSMKGYVTNLETLGKRYEDIEKESDIVKLKELQTSFDEAGTAVESDFMNSVNSILELKELEKNVQENKVTIEKQEKSIISTYSPDKIQEITSRQAPQPIQFTQPLPVIGRQETITTPSVIQKVFNNNYQQQPGMYPYMTSPLEQETATMIAKQQLQLLLDQRTLPLSHMIPIIIAIICLLLSFFISFYYILKIGIKLFTSSAISDPLNNQTADFEAIKSLSFFGTGSFNYLNFLLLPIIALGFLILYGVIAYLYPTPEPTPREIKSLILVIGMSALIMFAAQYFIYLQFGSKILNVGKRLRYFNRYICLRVYKNLEFLNLIKDPQSNIVGVNITIQNALKTLPVDASETEMAKAFFSLTMFYHYQKIGLRNEGIFKAFDLFSPFTLLAGSCSPGDYLPRYGTYIEDITESIIREQIPRDFINDRSKEFENSIMLCNEWVTNANGYANTIYPEDAYNAFIIIALGTVIVQFLPFIFVIFLYGDPNKSKVTAVLQGVLNKLGVN